MFRKPRGEDHALASFQPAHFKPSTWREGKRTLEAIINNSSVTQCAWDASCYCITEVNLALKLQFCKSHFEESSVKLKSEKMRRAAQQRTVIGVINNKGERAQKHVRRTRVGNQPMHLFYVNNSYESINLLTGRNYFHEEYHAAIKRAFYFLDQVWFFRTFPNASANQDGDAKQNPSLYHNTSVNYNARQAHYLCLSAPL